MAKTLLQLTAQLGDLYNDRSEDVVEVVETKVREGWWARLGLPDWNINFGPVGDFFNTIFGNGFLTTLFITLGSAIAIWALLLLARSIIYKRNVMNNWRKRVFLEIRVPRESSEEAQKEHGQMKQDTDIISVGEQIFLVMSEYAKVNPIRWLLGVERFSLEMLNIDQKIKFFVMCNKKTADVVERQIISTYSKADILRHKNVEFFQKDQVAYVQEMRLSGKYQLPFRTYKDAEKDPLNSVSNAISGIADNEVAGLQLVITPRKNLWQNKPRKMALKIQQGQNPEKIITGHNFGSFSMIQNEMLQSFVEGFFGIWGELFRTFSDILFRPKKDQDPNQNKDRDIDYSGKKTAIQLTPQQNEIVKKLEEKSSRPGFGVSLRVVGAAPTAERAEQIVTNVIPSFQIYDVRPFNGFERKPSNPKDSVLRFLTRAPNLIEDDILNTEEINSIWHIPNHLVQNPYIDWLSAKRPALPLEIPGPGDGNMFIGTAKSGMQEKDVYMTTEDRFRHLYALGGSGSGKSVFMTNLILQDIKMGNGVCVVDPHGETVDDVLLRMPKERKDDVIIFSPAFTDKPLGLNMLGYDRNKPTQRTNVIDTLFSIWDKLYDLKATGGPMFETYMKNSMRLVMAHEPSGATLMEISKILTDEDYRTFKLAMCDEQQVIDFWEKEAEKAGGDASLENMVPYITSKLSPFVNNDYIRPMVGQQKSAINFREAMDNKKIVLVKLEKGLIGEQAAYLVGMVVVGNMLLAGMGRNDGLKYNLDGTTEPVLAKDRTPFFVYIDEMQNFLFDAIPKALEEIRKYKVGFVLAHQFVKQVVEKGDERIKDSIMANCASKFIFRAGAEDAEMLAKEFSPTLSPQDLQNPERFTCNSILLADGQKTTPFNIKPPHFGDDIDVAFRDQLIEETKEKYGTNAEDVEKDIKDRVEKFMF